MGTRIAARAILICDSNREQTENRINRPPSLRHPATSSIIFKKHQIISFHLIYQCNMTCMYLLNLQKSSSIRRHLHLSQKANLVVSTFSDHPFKFLRYLFVYVCIQPMLYVCISSINSLILNTRKLLSCFGFSFFWFFCLSRLFSLSVSLAFKEKRMQ